ncbi:MAG: carboxypeptidase-like regulatory domain-containing protein [Bacteroidota bacterium]
MKVVICTLTFLLLLANLSAQLVISGKVSDQKQMPLTGANVFLQGSYDGTTADSLGNFSFKTKLTGQQTLFPEIEPGQYENHRIEPHFRRNRRANR